ncbi:MAG: YraN family protein [Chloroflexi bacterium]|nr:YraN family protein [Chloroflexota bacterium]
MNLGAFGEAWAVGYLTRRGYRIVDRNVRYRVGEIDIVARDGEELVFVEVKCRRSARYGAPEDSIDLRRYRRLEQAILQYLAERQLAPPSYRVDVVAIEVDGRGAVSRCELLQGVEPPAS